MIRKKRKLKKRKIGEIFAFSFLVLILLLFIFLLFHSNYKLFKKRAQILKEIQKIKTEIAKLEKENKILKEKIRQKESKEFLEKEARERFNLQKKGEIVSVILKGDQKLKNEKALKVLEKKSFLKKILEFLNF